MDTCVSLLLPVGLESCSPAQYGDIYAHSHNGSKLHVISHIGRGCCPSAGDVHAYLRIVLAQGCFSLGFALLYVDFCAGEIGPALQHIIQWKQGDRRAYDTDGAKAVYRCVRLFSHQDIKLLQSQRIVLACIDVLKFGLFAACRNHQQVCAADSTVFEAILDDFILFFNDLLILGRSIEHGTGRRSIPIEGIALVVDLVTCQFFAQLVEFFVGFGYAVLGLQGTSGIEWLRHDEYALVRVITILSGRSVP